MSIDPCISPAQHFDINLLLNNTVQATNKYDTNMNSVTSHFTVSHFAVSHFVVSYFAVSHLLEVELGLEPALH